MDYIEWIRQGLAKEGKTQTGLAEALGRAPSMVTDLLKGDRGLKTRELEQISAYLEIPLPTFLPEGVPIIGIAGAGPSGEIVFASEGENLGLAPVPPGWNDETVALEVRGNSMRGIAFDGWYVYYDGRHDEITDDMIGEPCVVGLVDGRVLVKVPYHGRIDGRFDLESANPAFDTMRNQIVRWAALVTAIIPAKPARRMNIHAEGDASV
jgi:transcriptional regulator with XRE-family HTH domain